MLSRLMTLGAALALSLTLARPLRAQVIDDVSAARDLFREGAREALAGHWDAARDRFQQSLKHKRAALTLYNLGVADQETGHLADAIDSFTAFLAEPVEPTTQGYVEGVVAAVAQLEQQVGHLELDVRPADLPGLAVTVDGHDASPRGDRRLDPGTHEIVVTAPGYFEQRERTSVAPGKRTVIAISLPPDTSLPPSMAGRRGMATALGLGGLALFIAGETVFAVGARDAATAPAGASSGTGTMVAGNAIAGAGALAAGAAIFLLLTPRPTRARSVSLALWSAGSVFGAEGRF